MYRGSDLLYVKWQPDWVRVKTLLRSTVRLSVG